MPTMVRQVPSKSSPTFLFPSSALEFWECLMLLKRYSKSILISRRGESNMKWILPRTHIYLMKNENVSTKVFVFNLSLEFFSFA